MSKIALITGATSGIGEATARVFANHDFNLIICLSQAKELFIKIHNMNSQVRIDELY